MKHILAQTGLLISVINSTAFAAPLTIEVAQPPAPITDGFKMGESRRPDGTTLTLNSRSFLLNGKPWVPVMGEFHYSRYPANEWREELLKMKAGGIDLVATYVFWIHHEEIEGQFDWSERRDLRRFIQFCGEVGLKAIVRCGPWCHGEVRNGGQPDWLLKKGWKLRSNDPPYLEKTKILYAQIAKQLSGLLWKDGGPVIGIQFENEYSGPAEHLLTLKRMGREAGLDVPIYTRTGWNTPTGTMPFGEVVPLYGIYAEGFWDRVITSMPAGYWKAFIFSTNRVDDAGFEQVPGKGGKKDPPDAALYPYLTCEIGGGMMSSYHRRIFDYPEDSVSMTIVRIGDGSVMPGYYMYHGGVNPDGKLSNLNESQATMEWNDLPVKNYDFQAPLGQYGQVRPHYHSLRRLHLFLHEWGSSLAGMTTTIPAPAVTDKNDTNTLRWCVRSDGNSGFVFVNNYQRLRSLPPKPAVQFEIKLPCATVALPDKPITVPPGSYFFWPFNLDLGFGVKLAWATAQPVTAIDDGNTRTVFFAKTPGIKARFALANRPALDLKPGRKAALETKAASGQTVRIVLLNEADSLALWKNQWQGADSVFLTQAALVPDGKTLRLSSTNRDDLSLRVYPAPQPDRADKKVRRQSDGIFEQLIPEKPGAVALKVSFDKIQAVGPAREIPIGKIQQPVAASPVDADFEKAAVWRIKLPANIDLSTDPLLRIHYVGDVARVMLNGKLLTDDFYNGKALDIGLRRHAPDILSGDLRIAILPLRKDAPIYLAEEAKPNYGDRHEIAELRGIDLVPQYHVELVGQ